MKTLKTFETWNNNIIDNSLFVSGRAKYNPKVSNGAIRYKTGNTEPYYYAEITKKGDKFICKIYKKKKDGTEIRLRNKLKTSLKLSHNYVREFLNQKLKKKKKKNANKEEKIRRPEEQFSDIPMTLPTPPPMLPIAPPKSKTTIRRF